MFRITMFLHPTFIYFGLIIPLTNSSLLSSNSDNLEPEKLILKFAGIEYLTSLSEFFN